MIYSFFFLQKLNLLCWIFQVFKNVQYTSSKAHRGKVAFRVVIMYWYLWLRKDYLLHTSYQTAWISLFCMCDIWVLCGMTVQYTYLHLQLLVCLVNIHYSLISCLQSDRPPLTDHQCLQSLFHGHIQLLKTCYLAFIVFWFLH